MVRRPAGNAGKPADIGVVIAGPDRLVANAIDISTRAAATDEGTPVNFNSGYSTKPGETNQCVYCGASLGSEPHIAHYPLCEAHSDAHRLGVGLFAVSCRTGQCGFSPTKEPRCSAS